MRFRSIFLAASIVAAVQPIRLYSQAVGSITGTVVDPAGAAIPGARVTAVQKSTAFTRSTVTSGAGTYTLPQMAVGGYSVSVQVSGFETESRDVTLDVEQNRELDFTLRLRGVQSTVEVSDVAPTINTTTGTLGGLVTGQQVVTLPLNGRDVTALVLMQPGVNFEVNSSWPSTSNPSGNQFIASNGNRGTTGASTLDGMDTSDNELGGGQFTNFNLDAVAEFRVLQNNYSAEYGRGAGTIVQLVSKSGTNELHGSVFEFIRNSDLDARNFFATTVPPFKRNEFGGTIGGPVRIPHVYNGKDKTFFFFQYAGFRQVLGEPILLSVPTVGERNGIVNITGPNGQPDQLNVPLNPNAKQILNAYPLPNEPNGPLGANTFAFETSIPQNTNQWSARGDQRFGEKDTIFFRLTKDNNSVPLQDPSLAILQRSFSSSLGNNEYNIGGSETHIFTPTLLNSFRFSYTKTDDPWKSGQPGNMPLDNFTDGSLSNYGPSLGCCSLHIATYLFNDGVTWTKGKHTISTGVEFRYLDDTSRDTTGLQGQYFFSPGEPLPVTITSSSGQTTLPAGSPSPSSLISFMTGAPSNYESPFSFPGFSSSTRVFPAWEWLRYSLNGWFQDDIKLSHKLTLNLGLRYEYNSVPYEIDGRAQGIVDTPNFDNGQLFHEFVLNPSPIYLPDYHGWGPRLGYAYKLTNKTVLRGGLGIFTNLPLTQTADQQGAGGDAIASIPNPVFQLTSLAITPPSLVDYSGNPLPPNGNIKDLKPNTPVNLLPLEQYFGNPLLVNLTALNFHNGYTIAGNFTVEQELPAGMALQVAYVTNNAVGLYASEYPNGYTGAQSQYTPYTNATPGFGEFQLTDNHAHSTYNSLQTQLRKSTPIYGLQFQISYTWSKEIDNATSVFNGPAANSGILQNNPFCWSCEKSVGSIDFPQRFVTNLIYALPLDRWHALPKRLSQGWQITSVIEAQSGFPFTVTSPYGTEEYGTDTYVGTQATRPDLVQQPTMRTAGEPEEQFFSTAVVKDGQTLGQQFFATPGAAQNGVQDAPGNLGRNTFRTNPWTNVDFSLIKDTKITERSTLQFRGEFFNIFNLHAFAIPGQVLGSPSFGSSTSTVFAERQIQFALRLSF